MEAISLTSARPGNTNPGQRLKTCCKAAVLQLCFHLITWCGAVWVILLSTELMVLGDSLTSQIRECNDRITKRFLKWISIKKHLLQQLWENLACRLAAEQPDSR